jgi:hypothetical protein
MYLASSRRRAPKTAVWSIAISSPLRGRLGLGNSAPMHRHSTSLSWFQHRAALSCNAVGVGLSSNVRGKAISMVSNLKWRWGFGWGAVGLFVLLVAVSFEPTGIARWIALPTALLVLAFIIFQYRAWNTKGWKQVHNRAMLVYATIAGEEMGRAQREEREFDRVHACGVLAQVLSSQRPVASNELS